jgi:hypothetical protein
MELSLAFNQATKPCYRRLSRLEGQYLVRGCFSSRYSTREPSIQVMQSQMIGMQSSLDRILSAVQSQAPQNGGMQPGPFCPPMGPIPGYVGPPRNGFDMITEGQPRPRFQPHSNFVSPVGTFI